MERMRELRMIWQFIQKFLGFFNLADVVLLSASLVLEGLMLFKLIEITGDTKQRTSLVQ